jgi:transcriptional regulator with PAS, ATPase and Fis domain
MQDKKRLDVRCVVDLPVSVVFDTNGSGSTEKDSRFSNLSLGGALLDCSAPYKPNKMVSLKYELPRHGEYEVLAEITRIENKQVATRFYNLHRDAKLKLWDYLKENLQDYDKCPYCGIRITQRVIRCNNCGWSLNFDSPDYIVEHEKETFIKRLATKSEFFSLEDIYRIVNFVDVEILGIGKNYEIGEDFVGSSKPMLEVFSSIRNAASREVPVLIKGENGTGKELTARAIHERSHRKNKPFVTVNCAAMTERMLESDLFGDLEGEHKCRVGRIEYADGGTIFLDGIENLSPGLQSRLMNFIDGKETVKTKDDKAVDVRLIAATSADLKTSVAKGSFRKVLFKKMHVFILPLPPVNERGEDKIILARYFLNKFSKEMSVNKTFSPEAVNAIENYNWPGNVREIINKTRRAVVMSTDNIITHVDMGLNIPELAMVKMTSLREVKSTFERQKLIEAMKRYNNNISKVAKALEVSRPTIYSLKKKFGI